MMYGIFLMIGHPVVGLVPGTQIDLIPFNLYPIYRPIVVTEYGSIILAIADERADVFTSGYQRM